MQQTKKDSFILDPQFQWFHIGKSTIHGLGLISNQELPANTSLGFALIKKQGIQPHYLEHLIDGLGETANDPWYRVIGARFINHSKDPNVGFKHIDAFVYAYTLRPIHKREEITGNYIEIYRELDLTIPEFCY